MQEATTDSVNFQKSAEVIFIQRRQIS